MFPFGSKEFFAILLLQFSSFEDSFDSFSISREMLSGSELFEYSFTFLLCSCQKTCELSLSQHRHAAELVVSESDCLENTILNLLFSAPFQHLGISDLKSPCGRAIISGSNISKRKTGDISLPIVPFKCQFNVAIILGGDSKTGVL